MEAAIGNKSIEDYFRFFKNWDNKSKKDLIFKLSESMTSNQIDNRNFSDCFGAWFDNRTAEEIIEDIMQNRINNHEIEEF